MRLVILAMTLAVPFIIGASLETKPHPTPIKTTQYKPVKPITATYEPASVISEPTPKEPEMTPERCQQERNVDNIDFAIECKKQGIWWGEKEAGYEAKEELPNERN